jgi:hypothetical protein
MGLGLSVGLGVRVEVRVGMSVSDGVIVGAGIRFDSQAERSKFDKSSKKIVN